MLAFKTGAPHAGAHPLDDEAAFKFGDGADDDYDGPAQRQLAIAGMTGKFPKDAVPESRIRTQLIGMYASRDCRDRILIQPEEP